MRSPSVLLPFLLSGCMAQEPSLLRGSRSLSGSTCNKDTGATCNWVGCWISRGPTECTGSFLRKTCKCLPGFCADASSKTCVLDTYGESDALRGDVSAVSAANPTFPAPHNQVNTALCFSGGGSRSLSLVMGQLRALRSLGVMSNVDAISAVSGGSWATSVYMFARTDEESLLGTVSSPASLSMDVLKQTPPALGNTIVQGNALTIAGSFKVQGAWWHKLWQQTVNELILKPFDLDSREAFMAASDSAKEAIIAKNPGLNGHQFVTPAEERPKVFVMNGILLNPAGEKGGPNGHSVSFQMSPDYSGSPFYPDGQPVSYQVTKDVTIGGGLVETFAVGNLAPEQQSGGSDIAMPSPMLPLTLGDAIGISSAAYAAEFADMLPGGVDLWKLNPELEYWPVTKAGEVQAAINFEMGDAGVMDNTGLLAMLQRGARKVVWFVNEYVALVEQSDTNFCTVAAGTVLTHAEVAHKIGTDIHNKFLPGEDLYAFNVVFPAEELAPYLCDLQKLKAAGKPAVLQKTFQVLANAWWGIVGGYEVDTLLVYNTQCQDFENLLPEDTRAELAKGSDGDFANFPHYKTLGQNSILNPVGLTSQQVNLLAAQGEYAVLQNQELFETMIR